MKKLFLTLAVIISAASMMAQTAEEKAALKAAQQAQKAAQKQAKSQLDEAIKLRDSALPLMQKPDATEEDFRTACLQAAKGLELVTTALESGNIEEKRLFDAWKCSDDLASTKLNNELFLAAKSMPFDTLAFHNALQIVGKSKQGVLKYGNPKDDAHKPIVAAAALQLVSIMPYYAYDGQFNMNSNPAIALQGFDTYINYASIFPEVANEEAVKNPKVPVNQIAYYAFMCAYEAKDPASMEKYYDLAITFEAGAEGVKQRKVVYYLQQGDTARWAAESKKIAMENPGANADMIQNLLAYYQGKGVDKMGEFADEVLAVDPSNVIANYAKGYILFSQEKYDEALPLYQKCVETKPDYVDAQIQCGLCLSNMGSRYNKSVQNKKYKTQAEANAATEKIKDFYRKAIPYFEKVQELCPDEPGKWAYELKIWYGVIGDKAKEAEYAKLAE